MQGQNSHLADLRHDRSEHVEPVFELLLAIWQLRSAMSFLTGNPSPAQSVLVALPLGLGLVVLVVLLTVLS